MMSNENQKDYSRDCVKAEFERDSNSCKGFMFGAVIGGIVGAVTALILAPKSGRELRVEFNEKAKYLSEKTDHIKQSATEKTEKLREVAKEKGAELAEVAKIKAGTLTDTVSKQTSTIIENVKNLKKKDDSDIDEVRSVGTDGETEVSLEAMAKLEEAEQALSDAETKLSE